MRSKVAVRIAKRASASLAPICQGVGRGEPRRKRLSRTFRTPSVSTCPSSKSLSRRTRFERSKSRSERCPSCRGVNHLDAIRAFEKSGFRVVRPGAKRAARFITIPRHNPVNAFTMGRIICDSGIAIDEFKKLF